MTSNSNKEKKVYVALSGGIDSAASAYLLTQQGYYVTGIHMVTGYVKESDTLIARKICKELKIPFKEFNITKEFGETIVKDFRQEYERGNTPNPCVRCNEKIKFGLLFESAVKDGADFLATGHYAQIRKNKDGSNSLLRATDTAKDQSYFLYRLTQSNLAKTIFPLGAMKKEEVQKIAKARFDFLRESKESQDVCFLSGKTVEEFLGFSNKEEQGDIIDADTNKKVGEHPGVWFYTLGQREGLRIGGTPEPYFVCEKDTDKNILYVAMGKDNPRLYSKEVEAEGWHWINEAPTENSKLTGMIRYRQKPAACSFINNQVVFVKPQWITSPGQSVVLIDGSTILGGGIIKSD